MAHDICRNRRERDRRSRSSRFLAGAVTVLFAGKADHLELPGRRAERKRLVLMGSKVLQWGFCAFCPKALAEACHPPGDRKKQIRETGEGGASVEPWQDQKEMEVKPDCRC